MVDLVDKSGQMHNHVEVIERDISNLSNVLSSATSTHSTAITAIQNQLQRIEIAIATSRGPVFLGTSTERTAITSSTESVAHNPSGLDRFSVQGATPRSIQPGPRLCSCKRRTLLSQHPLRYRLGALSIQNPTGDSSFEVMSFLQSPR